MNTFTDCIDIACEHMRTARMTVRDVDVDVSKPDKKRVIANYLFTREARTGGGLMLDKQNTSLRVVDPMTDEGVWAIVDDVCNCNCHGEKWRINAEEKIRRQ